MSISKPITKLDLPALPPTTAFSGDNSLQLFTDVKTISVHEKIIVENLHEQALTAEGYAIKAKLGEHLTGEVNIAATLEFQKVRAAIQEIEEESAEQPYLDLQRQFDLHILQLSARSLASIATVTNTNIGQEVNRSPELTLEQLRAVYPVPKGVFQRLFGG